MSEACVTIVCCYNDMQQYERLEKSLAKQNIAYELLGIDNRKQEFSSCSSALNSVKNQIDTEYVVYAHQDIELPESNMLECFLGYLKKTVSGDVLGVAGIVEDGGDDIVLSAVRHGADLLVAGEKSFSGMVPCDTVDECFFGGRTEGFRESPFDEELCDDWHMYAVERCLRAKVQKKQVYVCDLPLLHHSGGHINHAYNLNYLKIAKHYADKLPYIRTVCGSTKTDFWHRTLFFLKREILIRLHRY